MSQPQWIARLTWPGEQGALVLGQDMTWHVEGPTDEGLERGMRIANMLSSPPIYRYSPAHGQPGHRIAREIARSFGAQIELAPVERAEPGTVY